jgi:transcriptional regulator of acetoin/glycerol metabolism
LSILRARREGAERLACSPLAMRVLRAYDWPGNVRQLFAVLERAAGEADFGRIVAQFLPPELRAANAEREQRYRGAGAADEERAAIVAALAQTGGALAQSAELLGMGRTTVGRKLKLYGLTPGLDSETEQERTTS